MTNGKKKVLFLVISLTFTMCLCFIQNDVRVMAKDIRLTAESLNIKNASPQKINGIIYVPLRSIFEALGWEVSWDKQSNVITCTYKDRIIRFKEDSKDVDINNSYSIMDDPLIILNNKSYVPKRFITEEFGLKVRWNNKNNIIITSDQDTTSVTVNGGNNIVVVGEGMIVNIFEPCNIYTISDMISYSDRLLASTNGEEAIEKYKEILDNISKEEVPDVYAHVMNNLANAYSKLAEYKHTKNNILSAISSYQEALAYYMDNEDAANYSIILNNLGSAYRTLSDITGNNAFLVISSIYYWKALKYYDLPKYPMDYALIQYNMGKVYYDLGINDLSKECYLKAKKVFEGSLYTYSLDNNPSYYATIQFHLGIINKNLEDMYSLKIEALNEANIFKAESNPINNFKEALKVWTAESYPLNYAKVHKYLGNIYAKSYKKSGDVKFLTMAEKEYEEAIEFYSIIRHPFQYALANYELGKLKLLFMKSDNSDKYFSAATSAFENSLKVLNPSDYPRYYDLALMAYENLKGPRIMK